MNNVNIELNLLKLSCVNLLHHLESMSQSSLLCPYSPLLSLSSSLPESACICDCKTSAVAGIAYRTG